MKVARVSIATTVFAVFVYFLSCSSPSNSLSNEATREAQKLFDLCYSKCGDSFYKQEFHKQVFQYKDVTIEIRTDELSEANKMNGMVWRGRVEHHCNLSRSSNGDGKGGRLWSEWRRGIPGFASRYLRKYKNGKWSASILPEYHVIDMEKALEEVRQECSDSRIDCQEIALIKERQL